MAGEARGRARGVPVGGRGRVGADERAQDAGRERNVEGVVRGSGSVRGLGQRVRGVVVDVDWVQCAEGAIQQRVS